MKHTCRHTHKNLSLGRATVPWCRHYLGQVSLFHIFWPKVGRASPIGYISYNLWHRHCGKYVEMIHIH